MTGEGFRGGVHAVAGSLAFAMMAYNAMRFTDTHARRHAVNAGLYAALWAFEVFHQAPLHYQAVADVEPEMLGIGA